LARAEREVSMATWSVLVEARSPDDAETLVEDDPAIGRFFDLLWPEYGGAVSAGGLYWSARISVDVDDLLEVFSTAVTVVEKAAGHAGLPDWPVVRAELVTDDELRMQLEIPNFPVVMGTAEVVERLGVSRQRLTELRASGRFPEPILTLAATPVWLAGAVDAFVETWDRSPGRRRLMAPPPVLEHLKDNDDTWVDEMEGRK
jgi:hypothetical protein